MSAAIPEAMKLVRGEYLEVPGLDLTKGQVRVMWDLDAPTCDHVVDALVGLQFLPRPPAGSSIRTPRPTAA